MTQRLCRSCGGFHDLGEDWPVGCLSHFATRGQRGEGPQIIRDIDTYKAVAGDVALGGKNPVIGGRRQHREFLKRNRYVEVGNEPIKPKKWDYGSEVTGRDIKQTIDQLRSRR